MFESPGHNTKIEEKKLGGKKANNQATAWT